MTATLDGAGDAVGHETPPFHQVDLSSTSFSPRSHQNGIALALAGLIFVADVATGSRTECAALYAPVLLILFHRTVDRSLLWLWTSTCILATVASLLLSRHANLGAQPWEQLATALLTVASTAFLLMRNPAPAIVNEAPLKGANDDDERQERELLQRARADLDHAMRAASLGELSASIAHEVNQPLSAAMNCADAAQRFLGRVIPDVDDARIAIDAVIEAVQHASDVVTGVRRLLGKLGPEHGPVLIDAMVREAVHLQHSVTPSTGVAIELDLQAPSLIVDGDKVLLQQVLINLITNAAQALDASPVTGGHILIRTRHLEGNVLIEVVDNGPGFVSDLAARAFEPFISTKTRGMGLGLSICRSTIHAHGGEIHASNREDGPGAAVRLLLPVKHFAETANVTAPRPSLPGSSPINRNG